MPKRLDAQEVECIVEGKDSAPYEFGVKASIVPLMLALPGLEIHRLAGGGPGVLDVESA